MTFLYEKHGFYNLKSAKLIQKHGIKNKIPQDGHLHEFSIVVPLELKNVRTLFLKIFDLIIYVTMKNPCFIKEWPAFHLIKKGYN